MIVSVQIVILKLRQKTTVTAADHDQRHWKAAKVIFITYHDIHQYHDHVQDHDNDQDDHDQRHWKAAKVIFLPRIPD